MTDQDDPLERQRQSVTLTKSLLLGFLFLLPQILPMFFGWIHTVLALPIFYILETSGWQAGGRIIRLGLLLGAGATILLRQGSGFFFVLTLIPLGYSLSFSALRKTGPWQAGLHGTLVLALSWGLYWSLFSLVHQVNPYTSLLVLLDKGLEHTLELYKGNSELSADMLLQVSDVITSLRQAVPHVLPGILACMVIMTVWINLGFAAALSRRLSPEGAAWPEYTSWQLPDRLVWMLIAGGGLLIIGSGIIRDTGIWLLLVSSLLYCFQGLAVFLFLLERWNLSPFFRLLLYALLIIQTYGLLLLIFLGVAEIWFDLRKLNTRQETDE